MAAKKRLTAFFGGLLTGMLISFLVLTGIVYIGSKQTFIVRINTSQLAEAMEGSAQYLVENSIPVYLDGMKEGVPELVGARIERQFDNAQLSMGGVSFSLPDEFVHELERNYQESLMQSLHELLDTLPISTLSDELGEEISGAVINSFYSEFNHQTIKLDLLNGWLNIPVQIELVDIPGEQDLRLIFMPFSNNQDY